MLNRIKQITGFKKQSGQVSDLLKAEDVRRMLNVSLPYVFKLVERQKLPCVRYPSLGENNKKDLLRFKREDILKFIECCYEG